MTSPATNPSGSPDRYKIVEEIPCLDCDCALSPGDLVTVERQFPNRLIVKVVWSFDPIACPPKTLHKVKGSTFYRSAKRV